MSAIQVLAFVLLAVAASSATPNRIVGGAPTTIETYPSAVQVDTNSIFTGTWMHTCAANILNNFYVLSAAHCFDGWFYDRERRRIRAGATYRFSGGSLHFIVREFNHPTYGQLGYDGDISVVRLQTALTYSPAVQPGFIINQGANIPDNSPVVHAGWGRLSQGGPIATQLYDVTIYTINFELCRQRYAELEPTPRPVTENMICAGILDVGGKDACQGDSGGPLYYNNNNIDILVGIVSWGHGCANETYPGISTKVSSYTNWIIETAV